MAHLLEVQYNQLDRRMISSFHRLAFAPQGTPFLLVQEEFSPLVGVYGGESSRQQRDISECYARTLLLDQMSLLSALPSTKQTNNQLLLRAEGFWGKELSELVHDSSSGNAKIDEVVDWPIDSERSARRYAIFPHRARLLHIGRDEILPALRDVIDEYALAGKA